MVFVFHANLHLQGPWVNSETSGLVSGPLCLLALFQKLGTG